MKKCILTTGFILTSLLAAAQIEETVSDDDLFAPFRTVYRGGKVEFVNHNDEDQRGSALLHHRKMVHQAMNGGLQARPLEFAGTKTGLTVTRDAYTVRTSSGRKGQSILQRNSDSRQRQIDRQAAFAAKRREAQLHAARIAAARKAAERIADNRRAATAEAMAHIRLQGRTDANIARDYYNAGEGTQLAKKNAINTANAAMRGPQHITAASHRRESTGAERATAMRQAQQRKRKRPQQRRQTPPVVARYPINSNGEYVFTGRMTTTSIHIKPDHRIASQGKYNAPQTVSANVGFMLSPNAVVTTGRDSHSDDFVLKNRRKIPAPVTNIYRKDLTPDEEWELKMNELLPDA